MKLFGFNKRRGIYIFIIMCGSLLTGHTLSAQLRDALNLPDHDDKKYYLGIGFMFEQSHLQVSAHPKFLQSDSVLYVNPNNSGGFGVSGMFTFKIVNHLEFRFEAFNLFNRVNLNNPTTTRSSTLFGRITSAGDPRILQLGLRYA